MSRNLWKKAKMVSEIPEKTILDTKNILETGLYVPKWGTIKPRRSDARLRRVTYHPMGGSMELVWRLVGVDV